MWFSSRFAHTEPKIHTVDHRCLYASCSQNTRMDSSALWWHRTCSLKVLFCSFTGCLEFQNRQLLRLGQALSCRWQRLRRESCAQWPSEPCFCTFPKTVQLLFLGTEWVLVRCLLFPLLKPCFCLRGTGWWCPCWTSFFLCLLAFIYFNIRFNP